MDTMTAPATTTDRFECQICGNFWKAGKGLIAHHGYQRPGHGWQTASCFSARYRPFNVACDALGPYIEMLEGYVKRQQAALAEVKKQTVFVNPLFKYYEADMRENYDYKVRQYKTVCPVKYITENFVAPPSDRYTVTFEKVKAAAILTHKRQIKMALDEIARATERRTKWHKEHTH